MIAFAELRAGLGAALLGNPGVVFPKMLLPRHAFDRRALLRPDRGDVEQDVRLPVALLGLVRLEQQHRRRAQHLLPRVVAVRLRHDARVLGERRGRRVILVVGVLAGVREHELRPEGAVDIDEAEQSGLIESERVVAEIPELDVRHPQPRWPPPSASACRSLLHPLQRHAGLAPQLGGFPALAEGQADHGDGGAALGVQRDRPAGTPDEISRMRAHHQRCFLSPTIFASGVGWRQITAIPACRHPP